MNRMSSEIGATAVKVNYVMWYIILNQYPAVALCLFEKSTSVTIIDLN